MALDAWLPVGFEITEKSRTRKIKYAGNGWQIYETAAGTDALVASEGLVTKWLQSVLLQEEQVHRFAFSGNQYALMVTTPDYQLIPVDYSDSPDTKDKAVAFAQSLRASRELEKEASFHDAIYVERLSRLLPIYSIANRVEDEVVLGAWLTGGVPISVTSFRRLSSLLSWLHPDALADVIREGGFEVSPDQVARSARRLKKASKEEGAAAADAKPSESEVFTLAGRPELEHFFNEHIIDLIQNEERYKRLGIEFPSAVILHGPPGCGKTYAVERLADFLGWPSFQIDASSVASPYIHDTSKKIAEVFDQAIKNSPSLVVIDEMEAFLADRQSGGGGSHHRVEEVAEFLRRIPEAIKNRVLIIAMTNRIEMIDPAILRRGRFDHIVKVDMASAEEVIALLQKLLSAIPTGDDVAPEKFADRLAGRPLSDTAFVVREGARLAARAGKEMIDQASLLKALDVTPPRDGEEGSHRKIGFI